MPKSNRDPSVALEGGGRAKALPLVEETETGLMTRIRAALGSMPGVVCWRNNNGVDVTRGVRYGLGVGSADLVGLVKLGNIAVFAAWEIKKPSTIHSLTEEQDRWLSLIRRMGGIAGVVTSPEEAMELVTVARGR